MHVLYNPTCIHVSLSLFLSLCVCLQCIYQREGDNNTKHTNTLSNYAETKLQALFSSSHYSVNSHYTCYVASHCRPADCKYRPMYGVYFVVQLDYNPTIYTTNLFYKSAYHAVLQGKVNSSALTLWFSIIISTLLCNILYSRPISFTVARREPCRPTCHLSDIPDS